MEAEAVAETGAVPGALQSQCAAPLLISTTTESSVLAARSTPVPGALNGWRPAAGDIEDGFVGMPTRVPAFRPADSSRLPGCSFRSLAPPQNCAGRATNPAPGRPEISCQRTPQEPNTFDTKT